MNKTLIIDGGLGKMICAIPALEKFVNANQNSIIISYYWTSIFWGNSVISNHIFDSGTKGIYNIIKDTKIIKPEPYYNSEYLNGKISLVDSFNREINGDEETMPSPKIYLSDYELKLGENFTRKDNRKVVVFQPFGNAAEINEHNVSDLSVRSLNKETTIRIIKNLISYNIHVIIFDNRQIPFLNELSDKISFFYSNDIRYAISVIANCDYFIGIDSSGQHIARAFDIPGTVFMGTTNTVNSTYSDFFNIVEKKIDNKQYSSFRLCEFDYWLANINNSNIMNYMNDEIDNICDHIISSMG